MVAAQLRNAVSTRGKQLEHVVELAMDVSDEDDGRADHLQVGLLQ